MDEPECEFKNGDEVKNIYDTTTVYVVLQPTMGRYSTTAYLGGTSGSNYAGEINDYYRF